MKINFNLQQKNRVKSNQFSIRISITFENKRIQKNTGIVVEEFQWDKNKQRVKKNHQQSQIFNSKLSDIESQLSKKYFEMLGSGNFDSTEFEKFVKFYFQPKLLRENIEVLKPIEIYFDEFISYKKCKQTSLRTIQRYENAFRHLKNALKNIPLNLTSQDIVKYTDHLSKKEGLQNITIDSNFRSLKVFLDWISSTYNINQNDAINEIKTIKKEWKLTQKGEIHPLEYFEVLQIYNYKPKILVLQKTKDLFLFQIFLGMRFSDVVSVKSDNFLDDDILKYKTQKTGEQIEVYIPPIAQEIRDKYNKKLPKFPNSKYNRYIKKLCFEAGVDRNIEIYEFRGRNKKGNRIIKPIYEIISSHDARRTFVNIAFDLGLSVDDIIAYSGHTGKETLQVYINKLMQQKSIQKRSRAIWENEKSTFM